MRDKEITIAGDLPVDYAGGGFFVVEINREQYGSNRAPTFSIGVSEYTSRQAWEMRNDGAMTGWSHDPEIIEKISPEAARVMLPVDGCWTDNGEPMQGIANGWYYASGKAARYEMEYRAKNGGRKNQHDSPDDPYSREWRPYWIGIAARMLRCEPDELNSQSFVWNDDVDDEGGLVASTYPGAEAEFKLWVNTLRPRWQERADAANAWMDSYEGDHRPEEIHDEPEFSLTFENGLTIAAKLDEHYEGEPDDRRYWYAVTISAPEDARIEPYTARFGGSIADYNDGRVSAREAAFGTARGLFDFQFEDAEGYVTGALGEEWDDLPSETQDALKRASEAFDRLDNYLIPNEGVIGR